MNTYYETVLRKFTLDRHGNLYFARLPITVVFPWMESSGSREKREGSGKYEIALTVHQSPEVRALLSFLWRFEQQLIQHLNLQHAVFHSCIQNDQLIVRIPSMTDRINLTVLDENDPSAIRTYFDIRPERQVRGKLMVKSVWKLMQGDSVTHYGLYICLLEAGLRYPSAIRSAPRDNLVIENNDERRHGVQWADTTEPESKDESI